MAETDPPPMFGQRFALLAPLATGDVAGVFLAEDTVRGDACALKLLDTELVPDEAAQRFMAEARVLARIDHPHVVKGRGHGEEEGLLWYAMDLKPNGSLQDVAKRVKVPAEHALALVFQVLLGLDAVHAAGLVHRDVKLTNVMLDAQGRACIMDLGVAHHPPDSVGFRTLAGQDLGTPGYRAPEQVYDAAHADARADLFSAGVLLYRLITRRPPHRLHLAHLRPESIEEVPPPVRSILLVATNPEPELRYPSAEAMAEALAEAHDALTAQDDAAMWLAQLESPGPPDPWDPLRAWLEEQLGGDEEED